MQIFKKKKNKTPKKKGGGGGAFEFDDFDLEFPESDENDIFDKDDVNSLKDFNSDNEQTLEVKNKQKSKSSFESFDEAFDDLGIQDFEENLLKGDYNDYVTLDEEEKDPNIYSPIQQKRFFKINASANKKTTLPPKPMLGFTFEEGPGDDVQLTNEQIEFFINVEFENMAEILCKYDSASRSNIKENLLKKKINILSMIHKGGNPDVQTTFFGLLSPPHVFHTLMCKKAITDKKADLLVAIFTLKPDDFRDEIVNTYEKIYQTSIYNDIDESLKPMNELITCFIKVSIFNQILLEKYFHEVQSKDYYKEAERTLKIITTKNIPSFINFMVRFRPESFKGICSEFMQRYGYSVVNFFAKFIQEDDILSMLSILNMSYMAPIMFYCQLLNQEITSAQANITLPYLLLDLRFRGLDKIMETYNKLYPNFSAKKISQRFENDIRPFVFNILRNYENETK